MDPVKKMQGKFQKKTCLKRKVLLVTFEACLPIINIARQVSLVNRFGKEFLDNKKPATRAGSGEFTGK